MKGKIMKQNSNAEEILLSGKSLDELIKIKMQQQMEEEIKNSKKKKDSYLERDISKVPKDMILSSKSIFKVFSKSTKSESFISGLQADGFLGLRDDLRLQVLNGELSTFEIDDAFISFEKIELEK